MTVKHPKKGTIETRLKVLTWNIWWRHGPWEDRSMVIEKSLAEIDADIIVLQEVWSDKNTNYAAVLADKLGFHFVYDNCMDMGDVGFGNAILSRWPITQSDVVTFYGRELTGQTRHAIFAEIDGPRGKIPIFATHLEWQLHQSDIRQKQVTELTHFVDSKTTLKFPHIICGDFNADPDSEEIRMLTGLAATPVEGLVFHDAWSFAGDGSLGMTWDNTNPFSVLEYEPDRRIDYIFVGLPAAKGAGHIVDCKVVGNKPINDVYPSDHFAVLAELRY